MNKNLRDELFGWYKEYAYSFAENGVLLSAMKKLKFDHSMRVSQLAKKIAREQGWAADEVLLAEVCGLFHDVGRYQQYREYKTFRDHVSVNHAELGCEIITSTGCLDMLEPLEKGIVYETTRMHNMRDVPSGLNEVAERYLLLVRDSDKLDIFYIIYDAVANNHLGDYPEIVHSVDIDGGPTDEVVQAVLAGNSVNYSIARSLVDFELILLQWVYDMHFAASYNVLHTRGLVSKMGNILPMDIPEVKRILQNALQYVERKLG